MRLNGLINAMFDGYKAGNKEKLKERQFNELETTPFLFGSDHLWKMYHEAESEEELNRVIDHMRRHECSGIKSYDEIVGASYTKRKILRRKAMM